MRLYALVVKELYMKCAINLMLTFFLFLSVADAQTIVTYAGGGTSGLGDGGPATAGKIGFFAGLAVDSHGNIYIADPNNYRIRKVDVNTNIISTVVGTGVNGFFGDSGPATAAQIGFAVWIAIDTSDNLYIEDGTNYRIRKVNLTTGIINTIAGTGTGGFFGDGGAATLAKINGGQGITTDRYGNLYLNDGNNYRVRKINSAGIISTVIGTGIPTNTGDGGLATNATISGMLGICADATGNIYTTDSSATLRKVDVSSGIISRIAGTPNIGTPYLTDGIAATASHIDCYGGAVDDSGNIFIADYSNSRIEQVDKFGFIHTIAGTGAYGYGGDGGPSTAGILNLPENVICDKCGNLYVADYANKRVRKITIPGAVTPKISISATPLGAVCGGTSVTYYANISGGGYTPAYKWYVNGIAVSSSGNTYTYVPSNMDSVRCVLVSSCSGTIAYSSSIHMVVTPVTTTGISITVSPDDTVCKGIAVTFSATSSGGGATPTYQWKVNGMPVGTGSTSYTYIPTGGDIVFCTMTSSAVCPSMLTTASNSFTMTVDTPVSPSITLSGITSSYIGSSVSITATLTGTGGYGYTIHWMNKGLEFATSTIPSITYSKLVATDSITAKVVINSACVDSVTSEPHVVTDASLGIAEYGNGQVRIYPNPVTDIVCISQEADLNAGKYRILDVVGKCLREGILQRQTEINISDLSTGIYLLEIRSESGISSRSKLVKN